MSQVEGLSREDLIRIVNRDRVVKEMLASRLASVVAENAELLAYIQELQGESERAATPMPPAGPAEASESPPDAPESPAAAGAVSSVP